MGPKGLNLAKKKCFHYLLVPFTTQRVHFERELSEQRPEKLFSLAKLFYGMKDLLTLLQRVFTEQLLLQKLSVVKLNSTNSSKNSIRSGRDFTLTKMVMMIVSSMLGYYTSTSFFWLLQ